MSFSGRLKSAAFGISGNDSRIFARRKNSAWQFAERSLEIGLGLGLFQAKKNLPLQARCK